VLHKKQEQYLEGMNTIMFCKKLQNEKCQQGGSPNVKKLHIFAAVCCQILMTFMEMLISVVH
jgi:hypothetical protein